jgi:hypothetical protein
MGGAMDILVLAVRILAVLLLLYGLGLWAWMTWNPRAAERRLRRYRGQRNVRLISELGTPKPLEDEEAHTPLEAKKAA